MNTFSDLRVYEVVYQAPSRFIETIHVAARTLEEASEKVKNLGTADFPGEVHSVKFITTLELI